MASVVELDGICGADGYMVSADGGAWEDIGNVRTYETWFKTSKIYTFKVKAYDLAGNESAEVTGSVEIDVTLPAVPTGLELTEPAGTTIGTELYTADETPKVKWTAVADAVSLRGGDRRTGLIEVLSDGILRVHRRSGRRQAHCEGAGMRRSGQLERIRRR